MTPASDAILTAAGLNKSFAAVQAARDISVDVPRGACWSLIGTNGAGKTTFVNMVTGYIKPDTGTIRFDGQDITALQPRDITRLGIRRSFQIPQLAAELTVLENMLIALSISRQTPPSFFKTATSGANVDEAMAALERFRLADLRENRMATISAGSKKLLDIAMAISGAPKVVMLDEPTSGVSTEEKYPIMDLVMEVLSTARVTILFVEHDMDIVTRYSERVLAFYDGAIIANDAPDEVMADERVQRFVTGTLK